MSQNIEKLQHVGIKDAADLIGIAEGTLRHWLCQGRLPYLKAGRRTVVAVEDVRRFIQRNRVEASSDSDAVEGL